jgi:hypothetical protein
MRPSPGHSARGPEPRGRPDHDGYRADLRGDPDWRPLEQLARICRQHPERPPVQPGDFMYMGQVVHPQQPTVFMYKHIHSRRYPCLADLGHAYTVKATDPRQASLPSLTCQALPDLAAALTHVYDLQPAPITSPPTPTGRQRPPLPPGLER